MTGTRKARRRAEKLVEKAIDAYALVGTDRLGHTNAHTLQNTPPCARYEGGEDNARLIAVWAYVAGLVGGIHKADELSHKVARLYDYKGFLIVATRTGLNTNSEGLFRNAWSTVGEFEEHVEILDVWSERWKHLWTSRRFGSDWRPSSILVVEPRAQFREPNH